MQAPQKHRLWLIPLALTLAGGLALLVDLNVAKWSYTGHIQRDLLKLIKFAEIFAEGHGVGLFLIGIAFLDPKCWRAVLRLAAAAFLGGLLADLLKLLIPRARPLLYLNAFGETDVLRTFCWDLSRFNVGRFDWQSFPSAHSATAVGFAIALSARYPRGRWWFGALAMLACSQRIEEHVHYLSDVCWGAAIGSATAWLCLQGPYVSQWFDRLEAGPTQETNAK